MQDLRIKFAHIRKPLCYVCDDLFSPVSEMVPQGVSPNGGTTVAYCVDENRLVHGFAKAKCHEKDHYNKAVGRAKAQGRLKSARYYQDISPAITEQEFLEAMFASN